MYSLAPSHILLESSSQALPLQTCSQNSISQKMETKLKHLLSLLQKKRDFSFCNKFMSWVFHDYLIYFLTTVELPETRYLQPHCATQNRLGTSWFFPLRVSQHGLQNCAVKCDLCWLVLLSLTRVSSLGQDSDDGGMLLRGCAPAGDVKARFTVTLPSCSCFLSHTHCCSIAFQTHHKGWNKNVPSVFPSGSLLSCQRNKIIFKLQFFCAMSQWAGLRHSFFLETMGKGGVGVTGELPTSLGGHLLSCSSRAVPCGLRVCPEPQTLGCHRAEGAAWSHTTPQPGCPVWGLDPSSPTCSP